MLKTVSDYINEFLNSSIHNFCDVQGEDYIEPKSVEEILNKLHNILRYFDRLENILFTTKEKKRDYQ